MSRPADGRRGAGAKPGHRDAPDPLLVRIEPNGSAGATVQRSVAHRAPGVLHLAVSVQVVDVNGGGWLLQRRAATKALFPDLWTNTCCTHPAPGEDPVLAATRRVREETGLLVKGLLDAGAFTYRALDTSSGLVEHEHDRVFAAQADTRLVAPDPEQISDIAVLPFAEALRLVRSSEGAPWAAEVLERSFLALRGHRPRIGMTWRDERRAADGA